MTDFWVDDWIKLVHEEALNKYILNERAKNCSIISEPNSMSEIQSETVTEPGKLTRPYRNPDYQRTYYQQNKHLINEQQRLRRINNLQVKANTFREMLLREMAFEKAGVESTSVASE